MKIKPGLVPKRGYVFTDAEGVTHVGDNWPHLVRVVAQYRAMNRKPPGDPAAEITVMVCSAEPDLCHKKGPSVLESKDKETFFVKIQDWTSRRLMEARRRILRFVKPLDAANRADLCRKCPYQRPWKKGCDSCNKASEAVVKSILGDRPSVGLGLLGCGILEENTELSIHLEQPVSMDDRLPKACWRRRKNG